jgi:hypothetical protein
VSACKTWHAADSWQAQLREHPEMLQAAMQQMSSLDDETLAAMAQQVSDAVLALARTGNATTLLVH